jgi:serine protease Do
VSTSPPYEGKGLGKSRLWPILLFLAGLVGGGLGVWWVGSGHNGAPKIVHSTPANTGGGSQAGGDSASSATQAGSAPHAGFPDGSIEQGRRNAIVNAAESVGPAVVSISVVQTRYVRGRVPGDPFGLFFDRYLPGPLYKEQVPALGSGVIIDRSGVVLTNEHVVHGAEQIKVTLTDGRTFDARIVGSDSNYDLAVVKINGGDLPMAQIGDSDDILVGEWAIAIGNPFGFLLNEYKPSVSVGVVSAVGRDIKPSEGTTGIYKNMIQTDAAINPGNSGGPLVNSDGKVIGINTFIFTESGGSLGIGFAIPINVAVRVVREILQYGEVRQVWTGIFFREITPYLAAYLNIQDPKGLIVTELEEASPADRAGIHIGDIIRRINGEEVWTVAQANRLFFGASIGDDITLDVEREGGRRAIRFRLEAKPRQSGER